MSLEIVTMEKNNELFEGYQSGRCDTILVKLNEKVPDSNSIILELNWTTTAKRRWIQITDWKSSTRLKSTTKAEAHWSRGSILIHCKGVVRGFPHMAFNVVTDHLISDLTHSSTEVTTCPNMLTPVTFFKMWELLLQHARRTALDFLYYLTRRHMRWGWNQDVNMVFAYVPLFYQKIVLLTYWRITSQTRSFTSPSRTWQRYFVTHTKWYWMLYTVWEPLRYSMTLLTKCLHNTIEEEAKAVPPEGEGFYQ